jgi:hypothetical protein
MIRSLIITALILIAAALLGLREKQQLSREKVANEKLLKVVGSNPNDDPRSPVNIERRRAERAMKEKVQVLNRDFFALYRVPPETPAAAFAEDRLRIEAELKSRLSTLRPEEIKLFMDEFNNSPDLNLQLRQALNNFVQKVFIQNHPVEMARMMSESPKQFGIGVEGIDDPFQYLVYYYCGEKPDLPTVFQCLSEAPPEFQSKYIGFSTRFGTETPASRAELLEEMRYFATTPEQRELVNGQLSDLVFARSDAKGSFVELSDFLASANLSREELVAATKNMHNHVRVVDTSLWLDWLSKNGIPDKVSKERAFELASRWTEKDYQAVGNWLNSSPESPERTAVAGAYAAKTYPYDPENAMKWIQTLPQGPDRAKALETIYQGMAKDSDAAEAFASEYGLR